MFGSELSLEERRSWGVIVGSGGGTPDFTEEQYRLFFSNQMRKVSAYNVSGSTPGNVSSEVSLHFDLRGPSHLISTGCTSSTDALGYAFNMIRFGLAEHLVTGGTDATITPGIMQGFCVMRVVSCSRNSEPHRASRPFDRSRDGFVLGEGAWTLVLEERRSALARGAQIYAEVLGYGSTCDAYHRVRLDPNGEEPARAMSLAIQDAAIAKDEIGYVALHGTSTILNDRTETVAAKLCFGRRAYEIPMSSVKSMIGHPQGASGAAGVVAAIMAMNHNFLPPTINCDEPDPECDLNYIPNRGIARPCRYFTVQLHRLRLQELGPGNRSGRDVKRSMAREMMDSPDNPRELLEDDLRNLRIINRYLGNYRAVLGGLARLIEEQKLKRFSLLDVGTGSADIPALIASWARRHHLTARANRSRSGAGDSTCSGQSDS